MSEINNILDMCFEGKSKINPAEFRKMNEEISSDIDSVREKK